MLFRMAAATQGFAEFGGIVPWGAATNVLLVVNLEDYAILIS